MQVPSQDSAQDQPPRALTVQPLSSTKLTGDSALPDTDIPTEQPSPVPPITQTQHTFLDPTLKVMGEEQVVFDWSTDRCVDSHIPDLPARAIRGIDGLTQLFISHNTGYRMVGPDLNNLDVDCAPLYSSHYNADPSLYSDAEWIAAPYTEDGGTIFSLVHNEYQGNTHNGQCPSEEYFSCWYNAVTLFRSMDGGDSYDYAFSPPAHLVASLPIKYEADAGPYGIFSPSNIVKGKDGYYYNLIKATAYKTAEQRVCLMRTQDLSDPTSWRYWDGKSFDGLFINPYIDEVENPSDHECAGIDRDNIGAQLVESLTYNTYLDRYVLVGLSADWMNDREVWGFYYSFSDDLIHWTHRKLLVEIALPWTVAENTDVSYLYPSLLDPDSSSLNFETTGKTAYLFYTRHNYGQGSLDRDLLRIPIEFFPGD